MKLTSKQLREVEIELHTTLDCLFNGWQTTLIISSVFDEVVEDIEECADWTGYAEDEVNYDDIEIALRRVLMKRMGFND